MNYFLGIDVGTTGVKILVDENGELIAKGVEEYPFILHVPIGRNKILLIGGRNPTSSKTLDSVSIDRKAIVGIGLTGQMHGSVFSIIKEK